MLKNSYIAIAPRNETEAYVCWNLSQYQLQESFGPHAPVLTLYICDITDLYPQQASMDESSRTATPTIPWLGVKSVVHIAQIIQTYTLKQPIHECHVNIPALYRDYVAELGCVDKDGEWLMLTQSTPLRMYPIHTADV